MIFFKILLITLLIFVAACSCPKDDFTNSTWKNCGETAGFTDILQFDNQHNFVRGDTVFTADHIPVAVVDSVILYYNERRLYVKSIITQQTYRFCEKQCSKKVQTS